MHACMYICMLTNRRQLILSGCVSARRRRRRRRWPSKCVFLLLFLLFFFSVCSKATAACFSISLLSSKLWPSDRCRPHRQATQILHLLSSSLVHVFDISLPAEEKHHRHQQPGSLVSMPVHSTDAWTDGPTNDPVSGIRLLGWQLLSSYEQKS